MKITTNRKIETSELLTLETTAETAQESAEELANQPAIIGARFKGMQGPDKGLFAVVFRLERNTEYSLPDSVAAGLVAIGYAEAG